MEYDLIICIYGCHRQILNKNIYFHSGGPGFIITFSCLEKLYPLLENIIPNWIQTCITNNSPQLIPACDVAISYYLQFAEINTQIIKADGLLFTHCNYKGEPCHKNQIVLQKLISCHLMSLEDFDNFTNILEENNYFINRAKFLE
jgi:hypothetical protein